MKKLISLMLALIMVFSLATVASAEEAAWDGTYADSTAGSFTLKKVYEGTTKVTETLKFEVSNNKYKEDKDATAASSDFDITINEVEVTETTALNNDGKLEAQITVAYPAFSAAGFYTFDITETKGDILGMTYSSTPISCVIHVGYDNDKHCYTVLSAGAVVDGTKVESYTNTLATTSMTLDKVVKGNMASQTQDFKFTVTISVPDGAAEGTNIDSTIRFGGAEGIYYAANQTVSSGEVTLCANDNAYTITGIPVGAKIVVTETDAVDYTFIGDSDDDNIVTTGGTVNATAKTVTISSASADGNAVTIVNEKDESVATGIVTDSAPYIILIAVCAVAAVAFVLKRRNAVEF